MLSRERENNTFIPFLIRDVIMKRGTYFPKHLYKKVGQKIQMLHTYIKRLDLFKQYPSMEGFGTTKTVGEWQETREERRLLVLGSKLPDSKMSESLEEEI